MSRCLHLPNKAVAFAALLIAHHSVVFSVGRADIRPHYGDGTILDRSEVIAIGHLKKGTVRRVPHPGGMSHEHHATLVVKETLKGDSGEREVTLLIQHGLAFATIDQRIEIRDTSTSPVRFSPIVFDARQDQIWFLRKLRSGDGQRNAPEMWGIRDPEDVHNADLVGFFKILLSPKPEAGIRDLLKVRPEFAGRAVEYLEYRDVQKIFQEPDRSKRFQRLLPYYLGAAHDSTRMSVRRALIDGGPASGPYLMAAFHSLMHRRQRGDIIHIWAWTRYAGCADLLHNLLDTNHIQYVRLQARLEQQKMDSKIDPRYVEQLADEVAAAVYALGEINDPGAAEAIEETRTRWQKIKTYRGNILENCDRAVQRIKKRTDRRSQ